MLININFKEKIVKISTLDKTIEYKIVASTTSVDGIAIQCYPKEKNK